MRNKTLFITAILLLSVWTSSWATVSGIDNQTGLLENDNSGLNVEKALAPLPPPVIVKSYPAQDTIFTVGDSILSGVKATIPSGTIDEAFVFLSFDGVNPFQKETLKKLGDNLYGSVGAPEVPMTLYVKYFVVGNGDTTSTDYFKYTAQCGVIDTVEALEADEIHSTDFKAHWSTSPDAASYRVSVWKVEDEDSINVHYTTVEEDTFFVAEDLDENTTYYYNVVVVTPAACESNASNTMAVNTATVTGLQELKFHPIVIVHNSLIRVQTQIKTNVEIYHISGKTIHQTCINSDTEFGVKQGIYLVKVNDEVNKVVVP